MNTQEPVYIFSVSQGKSSLDDLSATIETENTLESLGVSFNKVLGSWEGKTEQSFVVSALRDGASSLVRSLCKKYKQVCYLYLTACRTVYLVDTKTGEETFLGRWTKTETPEDCRGWTLDKYGVYWMVA